MSSQPKPSAKKLKAESTPPVPEKKIPVANRRILIVDDEPAIAQGIRDLLSPPSGNVVQFRKSSRSSTAAPAPVQTGYEITVVHSPKAALDEIKKACAEGRPFAMGFFDVMLGAGIDGVELVKEIRKIDPNIYAVFVTAYNDRSVDSINKILGSHDMWDYLNKPFSEGEILQKARGTTAFWNLKREKMLQEQKLSQINRQLVMNEKLMSVATVARGVGHEFGNILVQIMGRAELSRNGNEQQMRDALDTILKASETAGHILERFKNLAKPSEVKTEKSEIWAHDAIDTALSLMEHVLKTSNIKVCRIKQDRVKIIANENSLVQVFVNLIINATHAMAKSSGQIDFSVLKLGNRVDIHVRDFGTGIPNDIIDRIFEPFFSTKKNQGTGLGLAICKEIIEVEHSGRIKVENHRDKGAEFTISLPLDPYQTSLTDENELLPTKEE